MRTFPERLKKLTGMPKKLYYIGNLPDPAKTFGSSGGGENVQSLRKSAMAFKYARTMAEHGVQIISGMAKGIDAEGHKGALGDGHAYFCSSGKRRWMCVIRHPTGGFTSGFWKKEAEFISELPPGISAPKLDISCKKPDHQRPVRCSTGGGSKRTKRISDHGRLCLGAGTQCLCPSGSSDR